MGVKGAGSQIRRIQKRESATFKEHLSKRRVTVWFGPEQYNQKRKKYQYKYWYRFKDLMLLLILIKRAVIPTLMSLNTVSTNMRFLIVFVLLQ